MGCVIRHCNTACAIMQGKSANVYELFSGLQSATCFLCFLQNRQKKSNLVESLHTFDEVAGILGSSRLIWGVHGKLCGSDIDT